MSNSLTTDEKLNAALASLKFVANETLPHRCHNLKVSATHAKFDAIHDHVMAVLEQLIEVELQHEAEPADEVKMLPHHRYEITYRIEGLHRKDRVVVMDYLGHGMEQGTLDFSARPIAGTQTLHASSIKAWKEVPATITPIRMK